VFESRDLTQGLKRGAAWLAAASPSRREIVVLSDFQLGTLTESDVAAVPQDVGVRFVRLAHREPEEPASVRVLSRGAALDGEIEIEHDRTAVTYNATGPSWTGLSITSSPSDQADRDALRRVLAEAGVHAADPRQPIALRLRGAQRVPHAPAKGDWTFGAAQRLLSAVRDTGAQIRVGSREGTLVVDVDAPAGSLAAARVASAALNARIDPDRFDELERQTIADPTLAAWTRAPAAPEAIDWNRTDSSDARLFWSFALVLLAVEWVLRRDAPTSARRMESHAA
jgi:hypothetical protein